MNDWLWSGTAFLIIPTDETINTLPGLAEIEKLPSEPLSVALLESLTATVAPSTGKLSVPRTTPEIFCWLNAELLHNIKMKDKAIALV